ncbi:MAG TPA: hypothetical protein DDX71_00350 [Ruminococcus sp.]|nr:hypothetical protein [Ruminococcus sp.]
MTQQMVQQMKKQYRILIGDDGSFFPSRCAQAFRDAGEWVVTRRQDSQALLSTVRCEHPDVLIMIQRDSDMQPLLKRIRQIAQLEVFILFCSDQHYLMNTLSQAGCICCSMPDCADSLVSLVQRKCGWRRSRQLEREPENLTQLITELLYSCGIATHLRGFYYLRDAITLMMERHSCGSTMQEIYGIIAPQYHVTPLCVERAIRHAISHAWQHMDENPSRGIIPIRFSGRRMSNAEFITFAADSLKVRTDVQEKPSHLTVS